LCVQVALVHVWIDDHEVVQVYGGQPHPLLIGDALGLDSSGDKVPAEHKNGRGIRSLSRGVATPTRVQNRT
jgi:hypothetical protein